MSKPNGRTRLWFPVVFPGLLIMQKLGNVVSSGELMERGRLNLSELLGNWAVLPTTSAPDGLVSFARALLVTRLGRAVF